MNLGAVIMFINVSLSTEAGEAELEAGDESESQIPGPGKWRLWVLSGIGSEN